MFALTAIKSRFVLFTGGYQKISEDHSALLSVYLLDTVSGQWLANPFQPYLNVGRSHHSTCSAREKLFVFGGQDFSKAQGERDLDSIEMTRITFL